MNHPGVCVGYRLFTSQGSVVYIPDNELFTRLKGNGIESRNGGESEARSLAHQQDQKLIEFIKNADVAILDSQYDADEYTTHVGWGHSCVLDSVALAAEAKVKNLVLFHHDPGHDDEKISQMQSKARELAAQLEAILRRSRPRGVEIGGRPNQRLRNSLTRCFNLPFHEWD